MSGGGGGHFRKGEAPYGDFPALCSLFRLILPQGELGTAQARPEGMSRHLVPTQGLSSDPKSQGSLRVCGSVQVSQLRVPLSLDLHPEEPASGALGST